MFLGRKKTKTHILRLREHWKNHADQKMCEKHCVCAESFYHHLMGVGGASATHGLPGGSVVKNPPANAGDAGSMPGSGRAPGEGNGNSLQCSCLGSPVDRGAWWATVHAVAKSRTRLNNSSHAYDFFKSNMLICTVELIILSLLAHTVGLEDLGRCRHEDHCQLEKEM